MLNKDCNLRGSPGTLMPLRLGLSLDPQDRKPMSLYFILHRSVAVHRSCGTVCLADVLQGRYSPSTKPLDAHLACRWCWLCISGAARVEAGYANCLQNPVGITYEQNGKKCRGKAPSLSIMLGSAALFCAVGVKAFSFSKDAPRPFDNVGPDNI